MAKEVSVNVYSINLTGEEKIEWGKREPKTWFEIEIPKVLEKKISKSVNRIIKDYNKNKK